MDLSTFPQALQDRAAVAIHKRPKLQSTVERLATEHQAAQTADERRRLERILEGMIDHATAPSRTWLLVVVIVVLSCSGLGYVMLQEHRLTSAVENGVATTAFIERSERGSCGVGTTTDRCMALEVTVYPDSGAPYRAALTQQIPLEWLSRVQPGSWLTVAVDPSNPAAVVVNVAALSLPPPPPKRATP